MAELEDREATKLSSLQGEYDNMKDSNEDSNQQILNVH
jgi:hypothetical protein